jgi:hypothetical protein
MKKILTLLFIIFSLQLFSQDLEIKKISKTNYEFNHDIDQDISIYSERIKIQFEEISDIKISNQKVEISFKKGTKGKDISRILSEISLIFNHQKYILI